MELRLIENIKILRTAAEFLSQLLHWEGRGRDLLSTNAESSSILQFMIHHELTVWTVEVKIDLLFRIGKTNQL